MHVSKHAPRALAFTSRRAGECGGFRALELVSGWSPVDTLEHILLFIHSALVNHYPSCAVLHSNAHTARYKCVICTHF